MFVRAHLCACLCAWPNAHRGQQGYSIHIYVNLYHLVHAVHQGFSVCHLTESSQQLYASHVIICTSKDEKMGLKEINYGTQSHTTSKWQSVFKFRSVELQSPRSSPLNNCIGLELN